MKHACFFILLLTGITLSAQTPQWNWAKGVGSNGQESVPGINLDSAGNIYEIISVSGQSIKLGSQTFTNPNPQRSGGGGGSISIFVKYDTKGNVVWAKQFPKTASGQYIPPSLMCTDKHGNSYLYFGFVQDSITLGGITARNTKPSGFCIANYDANGNVISIHVKGTNSFYSPNTGIIAMQPWDDGHLLIMGIQSNSPDTLDGFALPNGTFLAIMDTAAAIQRVKYLGHDTTPFGGATLIQPIFNLYGLGGQHLCANDNKTVYLNFAANYKTVLDPSIPITIPGLSITYTPDVLIKFDSNFNYQWHIIGTADVNSGLVACDAYNNVYLAGAGGSNFYLIKTDPAGNQLWTDAFFNRTPFQGTVQGIFTDRLGNAYIGGTYDSYLIAGTDSLMDDENMFVVKTYSDGRVAWAQGTLNAIGKMAPTGFAADGQGNVYINGLYFYTGQPGFGRGNPIFGKDTLIGFTPANGFPIAPDVFTARLGNCNPVRPILSASAPLYWCGTDSVTLSATNNNTYLWNNGDTMQAITINTTGIYSVYGIDTLGCYAKSKTDTVKAYPQPVMQEQVTNVSCKGGNNGTIGLTTSNATGAVYYSFMPSDANIQNLVAGTYVVTAIDSAGCQISDSVLVSEPKDALEVALHSSSNEKVAIATAAGGTPGYDFLWNDSIPGDTLSYSNTGMYRVVVTDTNGCQATDSFYVDVATTIFHILSNEAVALYPNPTTGSFFIETQQTGDLKIYNQLGALVLEQTVANGKNKIAINVLAKGIYMVEISFADKSFLKKLVLE